MSKLLYQDERVIGSRGLPQRRKRPAWGGSGGGCGREEEEKAHYELVRKEIEKMRKIRENMMSRNVKGAGAGVGASGGVGAGGAMNSSDITSEEFKIVCEELWIDFKVWANHHENIKNSRNMLSSAISQNLYAILFVGFFAVLFRWYVGAGRDACSYGLGYGAFSFMCQVLRYLGEILAILVLAIIGFCVGLLPLVIGVIIYEFNETFPRGGGDGDDDDSDEDGDDHEYYNDLGDHLKKE